MCPSRVQGCLSGSCPLSRPTGHVKYTLVVASMRVVLDEVYASLRSAVKSQSPGTHSCRPNIQAWDHSPQPLGRTPHTAVLAPHLMDKPQPDWIADTSRNGPPETGKNQIRGGIGNPAHLGIESARASDGDETLLILDNGPAMSAPVFNSDPVYTASKPSQKASDLFQSNLKSQAVRKFLPWSVMHSVPIVSSLSLSNLPNCLSDLFSDAAVQLFLVLPLIRQCVSSEASFSETHR